MPTATATLTPQSASATIAATCNPQSLEMPVVDSSQPKADDDNSNGAQQQQQQAKPKKSRSRRERGGKKTVGKQSPQEAATLLVIAPSETETNQVPPDQNCDKEVSVSIAFSVHQNSRLFLLSLLRSWAVPSEQSLAIVAAKTTINNNSNNHCALKMLLCQELTVCQHRMMPTNVIMKCASCSEPPR